MQGPQYFYNGHVNLAELERVNLSGARLYFNASHCDFRDLRRLDLRATEIFFNGIRAEDSSLPVEAQRSRSRGRVSTDRYRPKRSSEYYRPSEGDSNENPHKTSSARRKRSKMSHLKQSDWPEEPDMRLRDNSEQESDLVMSDKYSQDLNRLSPNGPTETLGISEGQGHGILQEPMPQYIKMPYQSTWAAAMTGFVGNGSSTCHDARRSSEENTEHRDVKIEVQKINPERLMLLNGPKYSSPPQEEVPYTAKGANTIPLGGRGRRNTLEEGEVREKISGGAKRVARTSAKMAATEIHPERLESLNRPRSPSPKLEPPAYVANGANASAVGKSRLNSYPAQSWAPNQTDGSESHMLLRRLQRIGSSGTDIGHTDIREQGRLTPTYGFRASLPINLASEQKQSSHTSLKRDRGQQNSFLSGVRPAMTAEEKIKLRERVHSNVGDLTRQKDVHGSSPFATVAILDNELSREQITRDYRHLQQGQLRDESQNGSGANEKIREAQGNYSRAEKELRRQRGQYGRALPSAVQAVKDSGRALAALYEVNSAGNIMTADQVSAVETVGELPQIQVKQEQMEEKMLDVTLSSNGIVRENFSIDAINERDSIIPIKGEQQTDSAMSEAEMFLERLGQVEGQAEQ